MAKQIKGVFQHILECAKVEFLANGYQGASLRVIAANAETTTGSIYTRFGDKAGLFRAIVEPASDGMKELFLRLQEDFHLMDKDKQHESLEKYSESSMEQILIFIYEHFDEFRLLLDASYGTRFQNYVDDLTRIEVEYTLKYMQVVGCESVTSGAVTAEFLHIITTAFFEGMFEIVRHNMKPTEAKKYLDLLRKYHFAGFDTIFRPEKYSL